MVYGKMRSIGSALPQLDRQDCHNQQKNLDMKEKKILQKLEILSKDNSDFWLW